MTKKIDVLSNKVKEMKKTLSFYEDKMKLFDD